MDFDRLYELQDAVLDRVFSGETEFYLTGCTCLHRFYLHKRHSDDLDLFTAAVAALIRFESGLYCSGIEHSAQSHCLRNSGSRERG